MNPASRLLPIIDVALKRSGNENQASREWWSAILRSSESEQMDNARLSALLVSICDQVDILEDLLAEKLVPRPLYEHDFKRLREGFSPASLNERWSSVKPRFSADVIASLKWAEWAAQEEEAPLSKEDLQALEEQIQMLDAAIQEDGIPASLRRMLRKQLDGLRSALDSYPICGIEPLRQAAKSAMAEAMIEKDRLTEAAQSEGTTAANAVRKFGNALSKTIDTVNKAAVASRSISTLITVGKAGTKFLFGDPGNPA